MKMCYTVINPKKEENQLGCMFTFENPVLFRRVSATNTWIPSDSCFDYVKRHFFYPKDTLVSKLIIISFRPKEEYSIVRYNKKNHNICAAHLYVEAK